MENCLQKPKPYEGWYLPPQPLPPPLVLLGKTSFDFAENTSNILREAYHTFMSPPVALPLSPPCGSRPGSHILPVLELFKLSNQCLSQGPFPLNPLSTSFFLFFNLPTFGRNSSSLRCHFLSFCPTPFASWAHPLGVWLCLSSFTSLVTSLIHVALRTTSI